MILFMDSIYTQSTPLVQKQAKRVLIYPSLNDFFFFCVVVYLLHKDKFKTKRTKEFVQKSVLLQTSSPTPKKKEKNS